MNACLNLIKVFLALGVRNNLNWLLRFLALETSDFSTRIHFLNLAIFWPFGWSLQLFCVGYAGFFLFLSTWIHLSSCSSSLTSAEAAEPTAEVVFSMEVSRAANLLNSWMNC